MQQQPLAIAFQFGARPVQRVAQPPVQAADAVQLARRLSQPSCGFAVAGGGEQRRQCGKILGQRVQTVGDHALFGDLRRHDVQRTAEPLDPVARHRDTPFGLDVGRAVVRIRGGAVLDRIGEAAELGDRRAVHRPFAAFDGEDQRLRLMRGGFALRQFNRARRAFQAVRPAAEFAQVDRAAGISIGQRRADAAMCSASSDANAASNSA